MTNSALTDANDATYGDIEPNLSGTTPRNVVLTTKSEKNFADRLKELKEFREKFGHVQVPKSCSNKKLYNWVKNLRSEESNFKEGRRKKHPLTDVQLGKLAEVGFLFDVNIPTLTRCFRFLLYNTPSFKDQNSGSVDFFQEGAKHDKYGIEIFQKAYKALQKGKIGKPRMKQLHKLGIEFVICCPSDEENESIETPEMSDASITSKTLGASENNEVSGVPESIRMSPTPTPRGNKHDEQVGFGCNLEPVDDANSDDELNSSFGVLTISKETNNENTVGKKVQKKSNRKKSGKKTRKRKKVSSKDNAPKVGIRRSARIQK